MPRAVVYARTNMIGSCVKEIVELPDNWAQMKEDEQEEHLEEFAKSHLQNAVDFGAYEINENETDKDE